MNIFGLSAIKLMEHVLSEVLTSILDNFFVLLRRCKIVSIMYCNGEIGDLQFPSSALALIGIGKYTFDSYSSSYSMWQNI